MNELKEILKSSAIAAIGTFFAPLEEQYKNKPLRLMAVRAAKDWALKEIESLFA